MIVKVLIIAVCAGVLYALIRNSMKQKAVSKDKAKEIDTTNMEKDPVCDTYVEDTTQYKLKYYNRMYFFCSQECLDKFKALKAADNKGE